MYAELKHIIAQKGADSPPSSLTANAPAAALDAVQLTSILSASGFHLDHFDIDRSKRLPTGGGGVLIEITCQRSGIVSRMHHTAAACTCPGEAECTERSAIWAVQGAAAKGAGADAVQSSSNLLPQLSPRKVQITKHLLKVMLEVFEARDENGNVPQGGSKSLAANNNNNNNNSSLQPNINQADNQLMVSPLANGADPAHGFTTPVSSINVTPRQPDDFVADVVGLPKVLLNGERSATELMSGADGTATGFAGNMSAATFASPSSDIFTSSPNTTPQQIRALPGHERDQVVASLRQIRQNIDQTLSLLDFDSTRNITTDISAVGVGVAGRPSLPKVSALGLPAASSQSARRHSLSVLPGTASAIRAGAGGSTTRRLAAVAAGGRASLGGNVPTRRPTTAASAADSAAAAAGTTAMAARRQALQQARQKPATPAGQQHVSTPRPTTAGRMPSGGGSAAAPAPAQRISLVQRSSMAAAAAAASRPSGSLSRNSLTRSMTRLPTSTVAAAAASTRSTAAAAVSASSTTTSESSAASSGTASSASSTTGKP